MLGLGRLGKLTYTQDDTPIYVISGVGQSNYNTAASDLGVRGFIRKPFRLNEIDSILRNAKV
ncbi:MAG: hypothetical protein BWZ03_00346 [bacterium ADurb.BinA186]|nr:MAG: hypothetical protein BWZ03_00346 [bacterium ADurb.BinA186]